MNVSSCNFCLRAHQPSFLEGRLFQLPVLKQVSHFLWVPPSDGNFDSIAGRLKEGWHFPKTDYCTAVHEIYERRINEPEDGDQERLRSAFLFLCKNPKYLHARIGYELKAIFAERENEFPFEEFLQLVHEELFKQCADLFDSTTLSPDRVGEHVSKTLLQELVSCTHAIAWLLDENQIREWFPEVSDFDPEHHLEMLKQVELRQGEKFSEVLENDLKLFLSMGKYFILNFIQTLIQAFALSETPQSASSPYEAEAMIGIYWKVLTIPLGVMMILGQVIKSPVKLYLATIAVVGLGSSLLYVYIKHFRSVPNGIFAGNNLNWKFEKGELGNPIGRYQERQEVKNAIQRDHTVLLHGPSGVGKTQILNSLPKDIQGKTNFKIDAAFLMQGGEIPPLWVFDMALQQLEPFKKEIILVFDEAHILMDNQGVVTRLKEMMTDGWQMVFATDRKEDSFKDNAVLRRIDQVEVKPMLKADVIRIIRNFLADEHYEYGDDLSEVIFEESTTLKKNCEQPAAALNLLSNVLKEISIANDPHSKSKEKAELEAEREDLLSSLRPTCLRVAGIAADLDQVNNRLAEIQVQVDRKSRFILEMHIRLQAKRQLYGRCVQYAKDDMPQAAQFVQAAFSLVLPTILTQLDEGVPTISSEFVRAIAEKMRIKENESLENNEG